MRRIKILFFGLILLFCYTPRFFCQNQIVSLTTGNYWKYYEYANVTGWIHNITTIKSVIGDTIINGATWQIINCVKEDILSSSDYNNYTVSSYLEYWFADENIFKIDNRILYDKRIVTDSIADGGRYTRIIDSTNCFGQKYCSHKYSTWGPSVSTTNSTTYCEYFGYFNNNSTSMSGAYTYENLIGAQVNGVGYGDFQLPLLIKDWHVSGNDLNVNFYDYGAASSFTKIIIYMRPINDTGSYLEYCTVDASSASISIQLPKGKYDLVFAYQASDGSISGQTKNISFIVEPSEEIVPLTSGNFWIYDEISSTNGVGEEFKSLYEAESDTIVNDKKLKKIKVTEFHKNGPKTYYKYWYSNNLEFVNYSKQGERLDQFYKWMLNTDSTYNQSTGYLRKRQFKLGSGYFDSRPYPSLSVITDSIGVNPWEHISSVDSIVTLEKIGIKLHSWRSYASNNPASFRVSSLFSAKIDNIFYGKGIPPAIIDSWELKNNFLKMNLRFLFNNEDIDKLIVYSFNPVKNEYTPCDSMNITGSNITYRVTLLGTNDLRFTFRTKDGIESMQSESIIFENEPFDFRIYQNYPNPFNGTTKISFEISTAAEVSLDVINILGQRVYSETKNLAERGYYEFNLRLDNVASGVYFYRVSTNNGHLQTNKMILLK